MACDLKIYDEIEVEEDLMDSLNVRLSQMDVELHPGRAQEYLKLGYDCQEMENYPEAKKWYLKSVEAYELLLKDDDSVELRRELSAVYSGLGTACEYVEDYPEAWKYYEKCLTLSLLVARETGTVEDRCAPLVVCPKLSVACDAAGDTVEGERYVEMFKKMREELFKDPEVVKFLREMAEKNAKSGDDCLKKGDKVRARMYYGMRLHLSGIINGGIDTPEAREDMFNALFDCLYLEADQDLS